MTEQPDSQLTEGQKPRQCAEETHQKLTEQGLKMQSERDQSSADGSSASSVIFSSPGSSPIPLSDSSPLSPNSPLQQVEEIEGAFSL